MLSYSETMKHLNMLDADFYFRLTDQLLAQDVPGTLLQLDETLAKGFEGDVILEGIAEHMRNLLLCKDSRMAKLLDVPNEHKLMYYEKANQAPPNFILSALNLINSSGLEYKNATNKRLHVEICLIRLCYLLQAVSADAEVKKNFEPLMPAQAGPVILQNQQEIPKAAKVPEVEIKTEKPAAYNISNEPVAKVQEAEPVTPTAPAALVANRRISKNFMSNLDAEVNNVAVSNAPKKELSNEIVTEVFEQYKQKLQSENKSAYHAQFSTMKVEMLPNDEIRIVTPNDFSEEYAKKERNNLIDFFRAHTSVMIRITTEVRKSEEDNMPPQEKILSKTEIYELMAQKNPNLAKLKDALNLQIDY
jgi:DNA polymerase-3 subunit gamma/tau